MAKEQGPLLFGRRMKLVDDMTGPGGTPRVLGWELNCDPAVFSLVHVTDSLHGYRVLATVNLDDSIWVQRRCKSEKQALRALEQMRERLIRALGGRL